MFAPIYRDEPCPLDGYDALSLAVLQNPTRAQYDDFLRGSLDVESKPASTYEARKAAARVQLGRGLCALYGAKASGALDFSSPEAALATLESPDLPDEIVEWLFILPITVKQRRSETLGKMLRPSSAAQS